MSEELNKAIAERLKDRDIRVIAFKVYLFMKLYDEVGPKIREKYSPLIAEEILDLINESMINLKV